MLNRSVLIKVVAVLFIAAGAWQVVWGVRHLSEPPMRDNRWYYGTSLQLSSISTGVAGIVLGWVIYRKAKPAD